MTATVRPSALFVPEIRQLLAAKAYDELKETLAEMNLVDLAEGWSDFTPFEQVILFKLLSPQYALELFEELEVEEQIHLLGTLEMGCLGPIVDELGLQESTRIFHRLPVRLVRKMKGLMRWEPANRHLEKDDYPEDTAGSLMHTDFLELHPQETIKQALDRVRASSRLHRMGELHVLYVTDDQGRLLGAISPRALIAAPQDMKLGDVMSPVQLMKVRADLDQEDAAKIFTRYNLFNAPVVNADNRLLGVLSVDDILHVLSEEATEDMAKMAGTEADELEAGSIFHVVRIRMPWLLASWLGGIVASFVVSHFQVTLAQVVALAAFIPVITGMGGNVGTQSTTIVVRGLATGQIRPGEIFHMVWRELRVGLSLGLCYGVLLGGLAMVLHKGSFGFMFPVVVGLGICTSMTVAAMMGAATPLIVKKFDIDPAVCSAPFVSTSTDIMSLLTYLSIATWLLL